MAEDQDRYADNEGIIKLIKDARDKFKERRYLFTREWYRNLLFLTGNQWIRWNKTDNQWKEKKLPDWVPTPVTNRFAATGERLASVLSRVEPNWIFVPGSDAEEDIAAAEQADKVEEIVAEENDVNTLREKVAKWLTYTGNCVAIPGVEPIFDYPFGEPFSGEDTALEGSEQGLPIPQEQEPTGYKFYTDIKAPFEVYLDHSIEDIDDQPEVLIEEYRDPKYIKDLYKVDVEPDSTEDSVDYMRLIGNLATDVGSADLSTGKNTKLKKVIVHRYFKQPTKEWPEGLYAVSVDDVVLESMPLPKLNQGKPLWNLQQFKFDSVPGAAWGRTPMSDLVSKQSQLNRLDSLIELITIRMSSPVWLIPEGTTVKNFSGEPGARIKYAQIGDKSSRPDRIPGEQIPNSLLVWRENLIKDFEELASTFEALKGEAPYSGAPGVVIEQLIEQGMTRFGPVLRGIAESWRKWMKVEIELFRTYGVHERTLAKLGETSKWSIDKFNNADIKGAVNVRIESDSTVPRSAGVTAAKTMAAINVGLIDVSDTLTRHKVLKDLSLGHLMDSTSEDVLDAVKENEQLMGIAPEAIPLIFEEAKAQGIPPQLPIKVTPFLDNHDIHIAKHRSFIHSDKGAPYKDLMMIHVTEHFMIQSAEMTPEQAQAPKSAGGGVKETEALAPSQESAPMPGVT